MLGTTIFSTPVRSTGTGQEICHCKTHFRSGFMAGLGDAIAVVGKATLLRKEVEAPIRKLEGCMGSVRILSA